MSTNLECHYAAAQLMTDGVNFRDLTRSVELFVVSAQVMADKIPCYSACTSPGHHFPHLDDMFLKIKPFGLWVNPKQ